MLEVDLHQGIAVRGGPPAEVAGGAAGAFGHRARVHIHAANLLARVKGPPVLELPQPLVVLPGVALPA